MNIIKASRINRTFPVLLITLIPFAIKNAPLKEYFIFITSIILLYSAISILNAKKDGDFEITKNCTKIAYFLIIFSILFALENKWILSYILSSIILGIIYNEFSRKIILGDSFIAGATHFALPFLFAGKICDISPSILIPATILAYFLAPTIAPITNIKDIKKDLKKGYKTLINSVKNKKQIINFCSIFLMVLISLFYILTKNIHLLPIQIVLLFLLTKMNHLIKRERFKEGLILMRTYLIFSYYFLIIFTTKNLQVILLASIINLINFIHTALSIYKRRTNFQKRKFFSKNGI